MGLEKVKNSLINEDRYIFPHPEITIQTTHTAKDISLLGSGNASNDHGYVYFYVDSDWKKNPIVYIGESKNSIQSRHNATHNKTHWFESIKYPFVGVVNSPDKHWGADTRKAIESLTVHKMHNMGFKIVNSTNSTWVDGGIITPDVQEAYVEAIAEIIVDYIIHHIGFSKQEPAKKISATTFKSVADNRVVGQPNSDMQKSFAEGLLQPNMKLIYKTRKEELEAFITEDGLINCEGILYYSPSRAIDDGVERKYGKVTSRNGWDSWQVANEDGSFVELSNFRAKN